jgi:sugar (pentulose or hexulose) kinase
LRLPEIQRAGTLLGVITSAAAQRHQLNSACQFTLGCLDQYAGVLAAGLLNRDGICETTGTVLATVRAAPEFDASLQSDGIYQGPSPCPGIYFRMLFGDVSARLLAVFRQQYTPDLSYEALDAMASQLPIVNTSVELLDFDLSKPRFEFSGDPTEVDTAHQVQAIYYKVAQALKNQVKMHYSGALPDKVMSLGGGANSAHWLAIKAHVLGIAVLPILSEKPTCLGAYRLVKA